MKRLLTFLMLLATLGGARFARASATDIFITASGAASGVCNTGVQTPTFFNSAGNWGAGAAQIGPDTIVHVCGTFTGGTNAGPVLTFQGSGTTGHPITILFESGALMTSPQWGVNGAITGTVHDVVVSGGTAACGYTPSTNTTGNCNGTIQNTANGTGLANHADTRGIWLHCAGNCEIKNINVLGMYNHTSTSDDFGGNVESVDIDANGGSGFLIHNNIITDGRWCALINAAANTSDFEFYNNAISRCDHHTTIAQQNATTASNIVVHDNLLDTAQNWDTLHDGFHHNSLHAYTAPNGTISGLQYYNNRVTGPWNGPPTFNITGFVFLEQSAAGSTLSGSKMFNNIFAPTTGVPAEAYIHAQGSGNVIVNNTFVGQQRSACLPDCRSAAFMLILSGSNLIENNIEYFVPATDTNGSGEKISSSSPFTGAGSDHNVFFQLGTQNTMQGSTACCVDGIGNWIANTPWDHNSVLTNPNLNTTTWALGSGSSAINVGANLTSLGIAALNVDRNGVARPASSAWDAGAIQFAAAPPTPKPAPPPVIF